MVKVIFSALIILISVGCISGIELSDIKKIFTSLLKTRQCKEKEVILCVTMRWANTKCQFQDGMISVTRNGLASFVATACSMNILRDYYTLQNALTDVYVETDEIGYAETASLNRLSVKSSEWEKMCFIQETVKCFEEYDCDIQSHSSNLRKVYEDCQKPLPLVSNSAAWFFKNAWAELKKLF